LLYNTSTTNRIKRSLGSNLWLVAAGYYDGDRHSVARVTVTGKGASPWGGATTSLPYTSFSLSPPFPSSHALNPAAPKFVWRSGRVRVHFQTKTVHCYLHNDTFVFFSQPVQARRIKWWLVL